MRKSFKDSLKALEADIQHANTLALGCPRLNDGACLQLRLSYSPVAHLFLFLVQWADCQLAGTLGLLRVLIYMASSRSLLFLRFVLIVLSVVTLKVTHLSVIFPSLSQLQSGITDLDDRKQKEICSLRYSKKDDLHKGKLTEADIEREDECGICMEMNSKVVLPNCSHTLCMKCYQDWRGRSQSCPFCRDSLKRVNSGDLWISIDHVFVSYDSRFK
ncbi:hypothetical protein RHGRI_036228 [Rhododendron griersonianum]|uniref:RING-type domain-containing protein n=1 Tax=Rhododendron griersonianum TaxID=479676 RepID=A0AAV6HQ51_9ERIC|nr:hypothetical protein RHGRI_036228 [Rhododendron griersonianum]